MADTQGDNVSNERKPIVITLIILLILTLIGLAGLLTVRNRAAQTGKAPENFVQYPTVSSRLSSSKDGTPHTIDVDLVVEYEGDTQNNVSHDEVYGKIKEAVSNLDYDRLKEPDSVEHIEESLKTSIDGFLGDESVSDVYVGNLAIDFHDFFQENTTTDTTTQKRDRLKGLFKNIK